MVMNINELGKNPYTYLASAINKFSSQANKTESYSATFEGKIAQTEKVELTEEEKLEAFKKEIWREIDSWPRCSSINWSIQITDGGFKRMMEDPEYKQKVMNVLKEDASVGRPPITSSMCVIDEKGLTGCAYMFGYGKDAFEAHSKGKDSFYVKKAAKHQEEKKRLEEEMLKKAQEKRAAMEEYFEHRFESQQRIQSFFKDGLNVSAGTTGVRSSAAGAMATAAYEQNSIILPAESI